MLREIACRRSSLTARDSASRGEETCSWIMAPLLISEADGEVKIQLLPDVEESDLLAASVLQWMEIVVSSGRSGRIASLDGLPAVGSWAFCHSLAKNISLLKVSCGDRDLFCKRR